MENKRKAVLFDLWNGFLELKKLNQEVADLEMESEKAYFNLLNIADTKQSKQYLDKMSDDVETYKASLDALFLSKFEALQTKVNNLPDDKIDAYIKEFIEKD